MGVTFRPMPGFPDAGRYAPSPSGSLHLGNLRTALIAWLGARSRGARFMLRIEDLDRERCDPKHERSQLADLAALGLDWDGPVMRQSDRLHEHQEAFEQLRAAGCAYPCWCTRADLRNAASAPHGERRYPGTCRELSGRERSRRARESGRKPAWRLDGRSQRMPFFDRRRGSCEGVVDDVILWRSDDGPSYNLAVVVDDAVQGVGEIVRGDDLIDSTPAQLLISTLLRLPRPVYLHVPLVLGADNRRLAKRDGAVTLKQRLAAGETIPQIIAWMVSSAGLGDIEKSTTLDALLCAYDPELLSTEPTILPPAGSL